VRFRTQTRVLDRFPRVKRTVENVTYDGIASPREPLDQYRRLIDSLTNHAIFALSRDGLIVSWNSGAKQTFGYDQDEVIGQDYALIFTPEDIASGRPARELQSSQERGIESVDGWHVRKSGARFWCTDTVQSVRDASGLLTGFTKIVQDSDESHETSERLRESEERLRLLIEGVTDYAIFSIDDDGKILLWNTGAEHVFGYRQAEVLGKHFSLIYTSEAIAAGIPAAEISAATKDGRATDEGWHVRRNGERFFASGQMTRLEPDADGKPRGFVKIAHDITERNEADRTNKHQAFHDDLTQLPNRAFFSDCLRRSIARTKRNPEQRFAVIFIDLDRFKIVNDSVGHVLADGMLVHVARSLEACMRPEDVVARLGGDEFAILVSDVRTTADAETVAERAQGAVQRTVDLAGVEAFTTASMGIAVGSADYDTSDQVMRDADLAMYEAKERGRAQHVVFDASMLARSEGVLSLQMDLRRAIARNEFCVEYQPIISLDRCRLVGFEALVRWMHPDRGRLMPADFIGEAEELGVIVQIDRIVLHEACRQLRAWQIQYHDPTLTVSVNFSAKDFEHEDLIAEVRTALQQNDLSPGSLKLEITETVLMEHTETAISLLAQLSEIGVEMYIDDFGTGYSSLAALTRFPLTLLKVDRSFVSAITPNPRSSVIARTVVTLAHSLGLRALAEGIETDEQLAVLRELGCELGQGYRFSRPESAANAARCIGRTLPLAAEALAV
jgi:diguanylate cyclase (GGDEF)-like protein/PAS domain S-box-containing protein